MVSIIVAIASHNAIGKEGQLLCHLPDDLKRFKFLTMGHPIVMGRKTFLSLPKGALPGRRNIVLTHDMTFQKEGTEVVHSLQEALDVTRGEDIYIIGGGEVYHEALPFVDRLYITRIHHSWDDADTFFPSIDNAKWQCTETEEHPVDEHNPYPFTFETYIRCTR